MKKVLLVPILLTGITFLFFPRSGLAESPPSGKTLEQWRDTALKTGSNIAYTAYMMKKRKESPTEGEKKRSQDYQLRNSRSTLTLRSNLYGGMNPGNSRSFSDDIALLTGERAIRESLQLGSIGNGLESKLEESIPINTIAPLKVKSHPWDEMLQGRSLPEPSPILKLAPEDHFLVHFTDVSKLSELEHALKELLAGGKHFFQIDDLLNVRAHVAKRLGIEGLEKLEPLVSEVAFVSEDLSFFPGTHYALILKFHSAKVLQMSNFFQGEENARGTVGEYFVIATSPALLKRIQQTSVGKVPSLHAAKDLHFLLTELDGRRDGMVYLSESFILRMVSPDYRINSARRNKAIERLESLQYSVLAYRMITGSWPASLESIVEEGYLNVGVDLKGFHVDDSGIVHHVAWGSLQGVNAVSDVSIVSASQEEARDYDRFRQGYQRFWRRFFDPVGIGISVGDQLYAQTVILPLLEHSSYNEMRTFVDGPRNGFGFLQKPMRKAALQFLSTLNFDHAILEIAGENRRYVKKGEKPTEEELKQRVNLKLQEDLNLSSPIDIFDMLDDELVIGVGDPLPLSINNLAALDIFVSIRLKDRKQFEDFLKSVYREIYRDFRRSGRAAGFLQLSSEEPLRNEYKGHEYFLVPAGFVNLLYTFHDDYVYFSINQLGINRFIDGITSPTPALTSRQKRSLAYTGDKQHMLLLADLKELENAADVFALNSGSDWERVKRVKHLHGYLTDAALLSASLRDGEPNNSSHFFRYIPGAIYGVPVVKGDGEYLLGKKPYTRFEQLQFKRYSRNARNRGEKSALPVVEFRSLIPENYNAQLREDLQRLENLSVGLSFTEHGLETRVAVNNPLTREPDPRFQTKSLAAKTKGGIALKNGSSLWIALAVVLGLSLIAVLGVVVRNKSTRGGD